MLVDPGAVLVWSGVVCGPGVWALRGGGTRCAMKLVAVESVTVGGRRAGRCCCRVWDGWGRRSHRMSSGGRVRAVVVAPGLGLGLGLAPG